MDAVIFAAMVRELAEKLPGARVNKVQQPSASELLLRLWDGRSEQLLYLRTAPCATLYLTDRRFANPFTPPRFCQLLRARLSRLLSVEPWAGERLAILRFDGRQGECLLLLDFRQRPNLMLLDHQGKIIDVLHRDPDHKLLPGVDFVWPASRFKLIIEDNLEPPVGPESFKRWLTAEVAPMTSPLACLLARQADYGSSPRELLAQFARHLYEVPLAPVLAELDGDKCLLPFVPAGLELSQVVKRYATLSESLQEIDLGLDGTKGGDLQLVVRKALERLRRREKKIALDARKLADVDQLRRQAELLQAQRHILRKGLESVEVEDYYHTPPIKVSIPLEPKLSLQENIDRLYKQVRKRQRGAEHVDRRLQETREELAWLDEMRMAVEECQDGVDRDALARDLADAGYLKLRVEPASRTRAKAEEPVRRTTSPSGFELVWGKNPRGNDLVSCNIAHADDPWFHVYNQPGCHLVLRRAGHSGEIPDEDILYAAQLTAGYSSARDDTSVEVMQTTAGVVSKPKGARPGLVRVDSFETIRVAPHRLDQVSQND